VLLNGKAPFPHPVPDVAAGDPVQHTLDCQAPCVEGAGGQEFWQFFVYTCTLTYASSMSNRNSHAHIYLV